MIKPRSAVSLVGRCDGRILAVWNMKYRGWVLPGGKVEEGETDAQAQKRELREETSLDTMLASQVYEHLSSNDPLRMVVVFLVFAIGDAKENEVGAPVTWLTLDELIDRSPFGRFYTDMAAELGYPILVKA